MITLLPISFLFIVGILWVLYKCQYPNNYVQMNPMVLKHGPIPWPIVGTFGPTDVLETTSFLQMLQYKHGTPMYAKFGWFYAVVINKADHVEALLTDNNNLRKSMMYDFMRPWFGNGLLTSMGFVWHRQRKLLSPSFHFRILADFVTPMNDAADELVGIWSKLAIQNEDISVNIATSICLCTLDIIMETAMGVTMSSQRQPNNSYAKAIIDFTETVTERVSKPWLWPNITFWLTKTGKKQHRSLKVLKEYSQSVIMDREKEFTLESTFCSQSHNRRTKLAFLDMLLQLKVNGQLSHDEVREQVDTFMFEGHDTTTHGILYTLYCLARHISYQELVRKELYTVLGHGKYIHPTIEHISKMKYLECCIKEAMRLYPPVPLVGRQLDCPLRLDCEHVLPKDTVVAIDFYTLHRDPEYFTDPLKFDPSRFMADNTAGRHPFAYCPFSGGPRNCIGQRFAMLEMKIVLARLLCNFEITSNQREQDMNTHYQFVLRPSCGVWVKLRPL